MLTLFEIFKFDIKYVIIIVKQDLWLDIPIYETHIYSYYFLDSLPI